MNTRTKIILGVIAFIVIGVSVMQLGKAKSAAGEKICAATQAHSPTNTVASLETVLLIDVPAELKDHYEDVTMAYDAGEDITPSLNRLIADCRKAGY